MITFVVYGASAVLLPLVGWTIVSDVRAGRTCVRKRRSWRTRAPSFVYRSEQPLLFHTMLTIRLLVAIIVVLVLTGWFQRMIEGSV